MLRIGKRLHHRAHIPGQFGLKLHLVTGYRVVETEDGSVQRLSFT
jgi:hypothetical protein